MKVQRLLRVTLVLGLSATFVGTVKAHHSRPGFDLNGESIELKGTVAEYRWRNPHVLLFWDVKDDNGNVVRWVGEFASVATSIARGMHKNTFTVGEEIIVAGVPAKAGTPVALIRGIVRADGTVVPVTAD